MKILPSFILLIHWTYTGLDKLIRFQESCRELKNQPMPNVLEEILAYAVSVVELLLALLLLISASRWWAYMGSLLTVFITYVRLIWVGAFPKRHAY
ncbi:DoxX protein [Algoriphagus boritolerans DSM 17298 = JCM 18970]|uniref:DoxX protein n=2 Tax=Algoriphagus TaxID=246875 RepID=A0A1H5XGT1_9BACT|nr:DoxX protein [Algoriphagus boritolerans DSM 17298 = JCM 18970]